MPNYRLDIEYDGTDFKGWQVQPGQRTVQGELKEALQRILRQDVTLVGAGRTDAGVHAWAQVASFASGSARAPDELLRGLNGLLPEDVRVLRVAEAPEDFSARHSAISRSYRYQMLRRRSAIWRRFYFELPQTVNVRAMAEAAELFLGDQDFSAFVAADAGERCRCVVGRSQVTANDHEVFFDITADRFLHNMVRRLAGALVEVGRRRFAPQTLREILRNKDRSRGGPCLPPHALFLVGVRYAAEDETDPTRVDAADSDT
jgi:tRNA pseudouridine38-40 synthase